jgi:hypothetical protein
VVMLARHCTVECRLDIFGRAKKRGV